MNKSRKTLRFPMQLCSIGLIALLVMASARAETPAPVQEKDGRIDTRSVLAVASRSRLSLVAWDSGRMPESRTPTITVKRSSTAPDSVAGMIKTTLGGIKFPDGSAQPAQAGGPTLGGSPLLIVTHDATLQGDGTKESPLGIKAPLILSGSLIVGGLISASPATENAVEAIGGTDARGDGAIGVTATGGKSDSTLQAAQAAAMVASRAAEYLFALRPGTPFNGAGKGIAGDFIGDVQIEQAILESPAICRKAAARSR